MTATTPFGTNLINKYYREASYDAINIAVAKESHGIMNDGVIGWLRISGKHPVNKEISGIAGIIVEFASLAKEAILAADPNIDYASSDLNNDTIIDTTKLAIVVVVVGHEADSPNSCYSTLPRLQSSTQLLPV